MKVSIIFSALLAIAYGCTGQGDTRPEKPDSLPVHAPSPSPAPSQKSVGSAPKTGKNWIPIETTDQTIAFSKIARLGKISVFIVSTPWCQPCKELRKRLDGYKEQHADTVDYYYVNMSEGQSYEKLTSQDAFFFARYYDRLSGWPRVVVTSPTGSILKAFSYDDLIKECREKILYDMYLKSDSLPDLKFRDANFSQCDSANVFDRTISIIERAVKELGRFDPKKVVTSAAVPIPSDAKDEKLSNAPQAKATPNPHR